MEQVNRAFDVGAAKREHRRITTTSERGVTGCELLGCIIGFAIGFFIVISIYTAYQKTKPGVMETQITRRDVQKAWNENRMLDNSGGAEMDMTIEIEKRWRTESSIETTELWRQSSKLGIPPEALVAEVDTSIEKRLGVSVREAKEIVRKENLKLHVPPRKYVFCVMWQDVYANGFVRVRLNADKQVDVPFRVLEERFFNVKDGQCPP
jgi:hypothetical protein